MKTDESKPKFGRNASLKDSGGEQSNASGNPGAKNGIFSLTPERLEAINEAFERRRELASARDHELFGVLDEEHLSDEERLALIFLYAHMPINDLADYEGKLFLSHVRQALHMRRAMPWGTDVPDELFLHYVLPPRINNERIEDYRGIIAGELSERVRYLSMSEAVLETNYWCYEKATYTGSDARTISPLGMIVSAKGRCGEESTLATAALRSIGIPARQCYTPRWAHVDDNHAWVEAWADGKWHFIGACEPEAQLDKGWFDGPARRAMLVHTRVPAGYDGPEPVTHTDGAHTEINLLANYAPVRMLFVQVSDTDGLPVSGAEVQFQLYNYAELHPIASVRTDDSGNASFLTGYGDLVVRAASKGSWAEAWINGSAEKSSEQQIRLILDRSGQPEGTVDFDLTPPKEIPAPADREAPGEQALEIHRRRMAEGERIRAAYESAFADEAQAGQLAELWGMEADRLFKVLSDARGNHGEIAAFLNKHVPEHGEWPLRLLESLTAKDMIDIRQETLEDHLLGGLKALRDYERDHHGELSGELFVSEVFCPRVRWERLVPYREQLQAAFSIGEQTAFRADPQSLARRIADEWSVRDDLTPVPGKASPIGTFALKAGDRESVEILLVALCRSIGIPARLHPATQRPQAMAGSEWIDLERPASAGKSEPEVGEIQAAVKASAAASTDRLSDGNSVSTRGTLRLLPDLESSDAAVAVEASYRENFTLARLENGLYTTLNYPFREKDIYAQPFELEAGEYRMTTGIRLQNGRVLGRMFYFAIRAERETTLAPIFRQPEEVVPILGSAPESSRLTLPDGTGSPLSDLVGSDGALVAWIDYRLEPTRHLLREAGEMKAELEAANVPLVFIVSDQGVNMDEIASFIPKPLPTGAIFVCDVSGEAFAAMSAVCPPPGTEYPHIFVLDAQRHIRYAESGYKPGSCSEALSILRTVRA
ncbi:transglutaminase domain-containing protein [Saccharibacillus endophyticus]|uniref:Transglutaminase n=1 Tax=Saccharibacillus endophyticus TaxID=2060666 RepID=A0ABQ1ZJY5_9BACL|nr:transglutaminase domain-containing protein [Saccharibacillus endophyticus]GGH67506.1 transglutaminase [Saccharibacillus endophyticus]